MSSDKSVSIQSQQSIKWKFVKSVSIIALIRNVLKIFGQESLSVKTSFAMCLRKTNLRKIVSCLKLTAFSSRGLAPAASNTFTTS